MTRFTFDVRAAILLLAGWIASPSSAAVPVPGQAFIEKHCIECHDADTKKGGLDLVALPFELTGFKTSAEWVKVYDRVAAGEMPPKKVKVRPTPAETGAFTTALGTAMQAFDDARTMREGRATQRRLNRYEYENAVRDLLGAPWLQIRDGLPEDGEAYRFNKSGETLDVSHVQMARYLAVADKALREVIATQVDRPGTKIEKYYARDQKSIANKMKFTVFNMSPERATFPVLDGKAQPDVRSYKDPLTVGAKDPKTRELEGMGCVASSYEPIELRFDRFIAPAAGRYKLRFKGYSVWVGPGKPEKWWSANLDDVSKGRREEPVTVYSETPPRQLRRLGAFDFGVDPTTCELDVYLLQGETIHMDACRLFRSRPPGWHNPLAEKDGCPGVVFQWMEAEGPIYDQWPSAGHKLMFADLPMSKSGEAGASVVVESKDPAKDIPRLLKAFADKAYRRPVTDAEMVRFQKVADGAMKQGLPFMDALIAGYTGVLCSPDFVCLEEKPGKLDDFALAARLSMFLWNSSPDAELRSLAAKGELHKPEVLKKQTDRMLGDAKSRRFVDAFLDYWLDLRKIDATSPDSTLYPDYYLDDLLTESAEQETQLFFAELIGKNLPARNIVQSDFAMLNERLARHYDLPPVKGVNLQRVQLPKDTVRGGLLTQASVLKVTANGTTTSPVTRGVWVMERIIGKPAPPPPPSVPAVEPDIRGATTIRQQLDKHRTQESCAACHTKIDPAGFALESFDVLGGFRTNYRSIADGKYDLEKGYGKNGQKFTFHKGPDVDCTGELPDNAGKFKDIKELKSLILKDERQVARNLVRQMIIYSTGAPIRFGDRQRVEQILDRTKPTGYGVRSVIEEVIQSELFLNK